MIGRVRTAQVVTVLGTPRWPLYEKLLLVVAALVMLVFALLAGALLAYGLTFGPRIYSGVRVAGVDVGGMTPDEARSRLQERAGSYAAGSLTLQAGDHVLEIPAEDLGLAFDIEGAVDRAFIFGRSGNLWRDSSAWFRALVFGYEVRLQATLSSQAVLAVLDRFAQDVTRPAKNARFRMTEGQLRIELDQPGLGIDVPATYRALQQHASSFWRDPIAVVTVEIPAEVTAQELVTLLPRARELFGQPFALRYRDSRLLIMPEVLAEFVQVRPSEDDQVVLVADSPALETYLLSAASRVFVAPRDARVRWENGQFVVEPAVDGEELDPTATVNALLAALKAGHHDADVSTRSVAAAVTTDMAEEAARRAERLAERPVTLGWKDGAVELGQERLASLLTFVPDDRRGAGGLIVDVDREGLRELISELSERVRVPPRDAVLRYVGGRVQVVEAELDGREVDVDVSVERVRAAVLAGKTEVELATRAVPPAITSALADQIAIRELISSGRTYYGGSAPNRKHNVELATQRVNGALVPPGGIFSFTGTVGDIDLENGYKVGYGIVATDGRVSTVPSVGGGVCQVSTTLFHAAFWGGFPIVERNWHLYWIPLYGQPPSGILGLDATVDTDHGLDFKFRNSTSDWIAIVAWADGEWVRFEIWGTKPGWRVEVDEPVVSNVVTADPTPITRESLDLAPGQEVVVEQARDGFDVQIRRRVYQGDHLVDELVLRSRYLPSSNVTLVGPNEETHEESPDLQPAPEDSAAPDEAQPTPEPTPTPTQ
jgi:vancomycin resistance protein YoaR